MAFVTILGDHSLGGAYILRIKVLQTISVTFGRFQGGEPLPVPHGELLYVGSAMRGLAGRVLRHARRSGAKPVQPLYALLLAEMQAVGLANGRLRPPSPKKRHWHIDYLLDKTAVVLTHTLLIRSPVRLEEELAAWLLAQPETSVLASGLGASDVQGHTHLLQTVADVDLFWERLLTHCG